MTRSILLILLAGLCCPGICHAQKGAQEVDARSLTVGFVIGITLPTGTQRLGGALHPFDSGSGGVQGNIGVICRKGLWGGLGVECTAGFVGGGDRAWDPPDAIAERLYPDYYALSSRADYPLLVMAGVGLSYGVSIGRMMVEGSLSACVAGPDRVTIRMDLKRKGSNEYRTITDSIGDGTAFTLVPAMTLRYRFRSSSRGVLLRASYTGLSFTASHRIIEERPLEATRVTTIVARHGFTGVTIGVGMYGLF